VVGAGFQEAGEVLADLLGEELAQADLYLQDADVLDDDLVEDLEHSDHSLLSFRAQLGELLVNVPPDEGHEAV